MKLRKPSLQRTFLVSIFGLLFAFFLCFVNHDSVAAKPLDAPLKTTPDAVNSLTILADINDEEDEEEKTEEETPETCYDQVKGIGWLVCPTTGVLAQAVDAIYAAIEDMLVVQPVSANEESPIFIVWQYVRDLTNIVFIILILIVIYSQLTGIGYDNYNIKKILPKLIITAILINLSFIICSALVDTSNILGASLRGFFEGVESQINVESDMVSWGMLAGVLTGGTAVAGLAISAAGGISAFIWMLIPTLLTAFLSVVVGLITIAMRQAVIALLIMIAPLAFVCYMLPNTNKWFSKWRDILATMLIFFPMFSLLFGASHLAGWALIAKAQQDNSYFTLILGMAVQVIPLFLCVPMMKMSGSILGQVSNKLSGITNGLSGKMQSEAAERRAAARARKLAEASTKKFNPISGASWAAYAERQKALRAISQAKNEQRTKDVANLYANARRSGRRITGWDENGRPIYAKRRLRDENGQIVRDNQGRALTTDAVKSNRDMLEEYKNREMSLATEADNLKFNNAMSNVEAYMRANQATQNSRTDRAIAKLSKGQAQNYLDFRTQQSAKARNDRSDQRFYFDSVRDASKLTENSQAYRNLIENGAGADAFDKDATIKQNALSTVIADSYDAYEKERAVTSQRYSTLFDKQVTKNVLSQYKDALRANNIDAVTAAQNTLVKRGDLDKVSNYLRNFMDQTGDYADLDPDKKLKLGSDFANTLALNLLGMKNADPLLGRLGKSINMETWKATNNERGSEYMTFEDYVFGGDATRSNNKARTSMGELMKGTGIKDADRTFFNDIIDTTSAYNFDEQQYTKLINGMLPQFISGIPSYESGGEQILGSMKVLTGMQKKNDQWVIGTDSNNKPLQIHTELIHKYIAGMTDKDLNSFKTDAFEAICEAIAQAEGTTCYKVDPQTGKSSFVGDNLPNIVTTRLREYVNDDMLATIQNNVNQGTNVGMKPKIMRAFGIKVPDTLPDSSNQ